MPTTLRASAILRLRARRKRIKQAEDDLAKLLMAAVPESLQAWLKGKGGEVIKALLDCGRSGRSYWNEDLKIYGCADFEELARRFDELQAAWDGVVLITPSLGKTLGQPHLNVLFEAI